MKEQDSGVKWFNTVFYPQRNTGRAARYEDGVLPRLRQSEIVLFTPWGPRYDWVTRGTVIKDTDREMEVLVLLRSILEEWQTHMQDKSFRWVILAADLYGTRINGLPENVVADYFSSLSEKLARVMPVAELHFWSNFDTAAEKYRQEVRGNFENLVSLSVRQRADRTAKAMGRNSSPRDYLVERLAEAMLIERTFNPIKISCVDRRKDDNVDWELPRLYFLPEKLQAPWM